MAPAAPAILVSFQVGIGVEWGQRQESGVRVFKAVPGNNQSPAILTEAGRAGLAKLAPSRL